MSINHCDSGGPRSGAWRIRALAAGALVAALAISGCSSPNKAGTAGADDTSAKGTIRVIDPWFKADNTGAAAFAKVVDVFHQTYPNVEVQRDSATFGDLSQKLTTSVISGQNYDVVMAGFGWVPPLAKLGAIQDLDKLGLTKESVTASMGEQAAGLIKPALYEDALYAVPLAASGRIVAYSKSAFTKAGLDPTKPPTTLAEIKDAAEKLTVRDAKGNIKQSGFTFSATSGNYRQTFVQVLGAKGQALYTNGTEPNFSGQAGVESLDWMKSMIDAKTSNFGETDPAGISMVYTGKAAMGLADTYVNCSAKGIGQTKCADIGYFSLHDQASAMFVGGAVASVGAGTKLPGAAMAFIQALRAEPSLEAISVSNNYVPLSNDPAAEKFAKSNPASAYFFDHLEDAVFEGGPTNWLDLRGVFGPEVDSVLLGKSTSQDALSKLATQAQQ